MSSTAAGQAPPTTFRSLVPARLDRLPWTKFHWLVITALGVSWILDGLEASMMGNVSGSLGDPHVFALTPGDIGVLGMVYLVGQVVGALFFGWLTDRLGRRRVFLLTLAIYLIASGLTGLAWGFGSLVVIRFIAGLGIGGEYSGVNSAIDELIPAKYRGRVDIAVNGTYWAGAAIAAFSTLFLLDNHLFSVNVGWRIGFFAGPIIGLVVIVMRGMIPESPRWLMMRGRGHEAEANVDRIEERIQRRGIPLDHVPDSRAIEVTGKASAGYLRTARTVLRDYPSRSVLVFGLMVTQSVLYNAIFFSFAIVLQHFYNVPKDETGYYFFPFAAGNLLGPLLLGRFFDTIGRRKMIALTYCGSGILLALSAYLFSVNALTATTQTIFWCVIFFFASAGASAGYLTMSEIFPLELRGQAIAIFFSLGQIAGAVATWAFPALIPPDKAPHGPLAMAYYVGAGVMFLGGVVGWIWGVNAEGKSLEEIAKPLSAVDQTAPVAGTASA